MKIVGFETDAGLRLGVIEGTEVVDLQAVDPSLPNDLAVVLAEARHYQAEGVLTVEMETDHVVRDIDKMEDYQKLVTESEGERNASLEIPK